MPGIKQTLGAALAGTLLASGAGCGIDTGGGDKRPLAEAVRPVEIYDLVVRDDETHWEQVGTVAVGEAIRVHCLISKPSFVIDMFRVEGEEGDNEGTEGFVFVDQRNFENGALEPNFEHAIPYDQYRSCAPGDDFPGGI